MHKASDGQRRRVRIYMRLLHSFKVLLLDEVTIDLDVVARMDLLDFLKEECEQRGSTIVYATHIFDGLETWATDLAYIQDGELKRTEKLSELHELKSCASLISMVEPWLCSEAKTEKKNLLAPSTKEKNRLLLMRLLSGHPDLWRTIGDLHQASHMFGSPFQISSLQRRQKKAEIQVYFVLDLLVQPFAFSPRLLKH